jgi:hypothetical protein
VKVSTLRISAFVSLLALFVPASVAHAADSVTSSVLLRSCEAALSDDADDKGLAK